MKKTVAVIFGGDSAEYVISEKSAGVVYRHLNTDKFKVYLVEIKEAQWSVVINSLKIPVSRDDFSFVKDGEKINFDVVFNAIHGTPGEDGKIQGYFEMLNIPYNNSGVLESALTFNKWACNNLLRSLDFVCAQSVLLTDRTDANNASRVSDKLEMPVFVKPNQGGSSFGVTKVNASSELEAAINLAFEHGDDVIVEEFIKGTEVTSGVINYKGELIALPITEIVPEGEFFDFAAKYEGKSQEITPARISDEMRDQIQALSKKVYQTLGLKGMIRVDYLIQEGTQIPHLIEVNTVPGLSEESIIPQQAQNIGIDLNELFSDSIEQCS